MLMRALLERSFDAMRVRGFVRALLAALSGAVLAAPNASAEVLDRITVERHDGGTTIRVRLTGAVHYIRHYPAEAGQIVVVDLDALEPEAFAGEAGIDDVKRAPKGAPPPSFSVRATVGQACSPTANPVCLTIRFERRVRYRVHLGEDRRSVVLELPVGDGETRSSGTGGDKP